MTDRGVPPTIRIAAAVITDDTGRYLLVRKRDTTAFMQAGGKIEPGEHPRDALIREIGEELAVVVTPDQIREIGHHDAPAAHEPGHRLSAHVFAVRGVTGAVPTAEIAEAVWVTPDEAATLPLAPLTANLLAATMPERRDSQAATGLPESDVSGPCDAGPFTDPDRSDG